MLDYDVLQRGVFKAAVYAEGTKPLGTFIQRLLFGGAPISSDLSFAEYDYTKETGVKIPEEALRGADPVRVNAGTAFNSKMIQSLYFYLKDTVDSSVVENRCFGEPIDKPWTEEQRMLKALVDKKKYHMSAINAAKEKMCVETILKGKYSVKNGGEQVFPILAGNLAVNGADLFTKPFDVFNKAKKAIRDNNGSVEMMIFNSEDWANFLQSAKVMELIHNNQLIIDDDQSKTYEDGSEFCGYMRYKGLATVEVWAYSAKVDGVELWSKGNIYVGPKQIGLMAYCGVPVRAGGSIQHSHAGVEVSTTAYEASPDALQSETVFEIASAPAAIPTKLDQWAIITKVPAASV